MIYSQVPKVCQLIFSFFPVTSLHDYLDPPPIPPLKKTHVNMYYIIKLYIILKSLIN